MLTTARTSSSATAQTSHSAWVIIKSGFSFSRTDWFKEYRALLVFNLSRTSASISLLLAASGMSEVVTLGNSKTSAG